ncbi:MAG: hypothetical protein AB1325_13820 [Nitrospirota bacterium]
MKAIAILNLLTCVILVEVFYNLGVIEKAFLYTEWLIALVLAIKSQNYRPYLMMDFTVFKGLKR